MNIEKITINIENSYCLTNTARWPYLIIKLHKYTQVLYLSFEKYLVLVIPCYTMLHDFIL